jgi:hypothetical protein
MELLRAPGDVSAATTAAAAAAAAPDDVVVGCPGTDTVVTDDDARTSVTLEAARDTGGDGRGNPTALLVLGGDAVMVLNAEVDNDDGDDEWWVWARDMTGAGGKVMAY